MSLSSLPARLMANSTDVIANISSNRLQPFLDTIGLNNSEWNYTSTPDWGTALWQIVNIYPDYVGMTAWFILFLLPFLMMFLAHVETLPAAVVGIFMGIYIFGFIGEQYAGLGVAIMAASITLAIAGTWLRRHI